MKGRTGGRIRLAVIGSLAALFIVFANFASNGALPSFLQKGVEGLNQNTSGMLLGSSGGTELKDLTVCFIDVGQGDSEFISCDGQTMLIDGGPGVSTEKLEGYLNSLGVKRFDYVVATHPDEDHIGGLDNAIDDYSVGKVLMTGVTSNTKAYENLLDAISDKKLKITRAVSGQTYTLGGGSFKIVAPNAEYSDTNDSSIVIRLTYKNRHFLFTGDAAKESEKDTLKTGYSLQADVLKVAHHGSNTATTAAFLKAVSPTYAVVSVGAGNQYGLPDSDVLDRLGKAGAKILRTDISGTVVFQSDGNSLEYKTEK